MVENRTRWADCIEMSLQSYNTDYQKLNNLQKRVQMES